jgi:hypothetical protein
MKVNLKKFNDLKDLVAETMTQAQLYGNKPVGYYNGLMDLFTIMNEIKADLMAGGESIIELDKPRKEAITELNTN